MSPVSIRLNLFACVIGADVLKEFYIYDEDGDETSFQPDPICIDDVSFWHIVCHFWALDVDYVQFPA